MLLVKIRIIVKKKPAVLDVEGKTISKSLNELGFDEVFNCTKGIVIDVEAQQSILLEKHSPNLPEAIEKFVALACKKLLVNEIIESYEYFVI